ncbi:SusC/RagA family TonB-linked outer membrane protein [Mariniflexile sp. AS56]|uniref:SusC/RagA family TonB-linked outer membrane protein n=1 Tax=Mariniflexile sp. AS56 TaxID=3063957 RepID=UPI0026F18F0C|nr:TonB-dependent receptor [Mariniflexile sp. AS56]MDO7171658.1 TonB-dependent receptor [Mariniflexile sp. AS56]
MVKLKLLLIALLVGFTGASWAQSKVSGVVADSQNIPIPGVNVVVKGTSNGAATDFDGNYQISAKSGDVLVFSYLGFKSQEVTYKGQATLNVKMQEDTAQLNEVVVIGYGSVKRSDLTGAVASLSSENITEQKKTDIGQAIQGKVAGVDVRALSNKPGAPLSIKIRGNTSITNTNAGRDGISDDLDDDLSKPLYVVDGIFFEDINALNPADIQQLDILKDASATAIYGARGANGVVIITTKSGIEGKTVFTYEATLGSRSVTNEPDYFNGDEYVAFVGDVIRSREWKNLFSNGVPTVADYNNINVASLIDTEIRITNEEASNAANRRYTNWIKDYQKTGIQTSHNLGMSGGSDGLVYNGSIGYLSDEGVLGIEAFERYNMSASLSKRVTDDLTVGLKTYLSFSEREEGSRELYRSTQRLAPTVNSRDTDGNIILFPDDQDLRFTNPYYDATGAWRNNTRALNVIANVFVNYKPTDWVNFKTQFSPNLSTERFGEYRGLLTKSSRNDASRIQSHYNSFFSTAYTWDNIVDFNFDLAEGHNLKSTLISSVYYKQDEGSNVQTRNFDTDAYLFYNTGVGTDPRSYDSYYEKETTSSFAARVNYSILDKYLFTFTGRYDGASKLAVNNKWDFFPSAAIAWKVTEEDFMQNTDWLDNLKLRLSYGESGNYSTVRPYESLAFLNNTDYIFGNNLTNGVTVSGFTNYDLTWERSKELNVGLDLGVLQNKIRLGLEVYSKTTDGGILARTLSPITGFGSATGNYGSVRNSGVEITLNTRNIQTENFKWTTDLNFARNKNEILELDGELDLIPYGNHGVLQIGEAVDAIWAPEKLGIWQLDEAAEAAVYGRFPGEYKFRDVNNDGSINSADNVILGQVSPDWTAGMTNTFSYKNLDLSVQVYTRQGTFGHSEFNQLSVPWQGDDAKFNKVDLDYWTPNNQDSKNPALEYGAGADWYYTDFDFVRVGNIGLGYEFSQSMLDKLKMSSLRLSLDIQNPFTFTDYEGSDPETGLQNNYNGGYLVKTILFGLKLSY